MHVSENIRRHLRFLGPYSVGRDLEPDLSEVFRDAINLTYLSEIFVYRFLMLLNAVFQCLFLVPSRKNL